jgi:hypothetical protein
MEPLSGARVLVVMAFIPALIALSLRTMRADHNFSTTFTAHTVTTSPLAHESVRRISELPQRS